MNKEPTYLGSVSAVAGSSLTVELAPQVNSGLLIIGGKTHRVGQVGSFVRIPQGYNNLYGLIAETSESSSVDQIGDTHETDRRWIKIELVGETIGDEFERGISQYPSINDEAHLWLSRATSERSMAAQTPVKSLWARFRARTASR